ncbi:hypothetical protein [Sphaerothrix gracilis]|uniref:hypothetical protein n=1 Tax=Sphaerothrix gracilis TaxID=3151835 RepID=UPI0031FC61F3
MTNSDWPENLVKQRVTYTLELEGSLVLVENVPARVNLETGKQLFMPETVEQLHALILDSQQSPDHFIQVPVYEFAS